MAHVLDQTMAVMAVDYAVEPDVSACMTQTAVDPGRVFGVKPATGDFEVVRNTLVFSSQAARDYTALASKTAKITGKTHGDLTRLLPVSGIYRADTPGSKQHNLRVVGVAYDGVESAHMAKTYPNERSRLVVQVTGTCTVVIHPLDLDKLAVGDLMCLSGEAYDGGLVGMPHYTLPKIVKYEKDAMAELARLLVARARTPAQLLPTSSLGLAAAIISLHRNTPEYRDQWRVCAQKLTKYYETPTPIAALRSNPDDFVNYINEVGDFIAERVDDGRITKDALDVARVVASVSCSVDELDKLYSWMPNGAPNLEVFADTLNHRCPSKPPFAMLLERGHSQARILLKPGTLI